MGTGWIGAKSHLEIEGLLGSAFEIAIEKRKPSLHAFLLLHFRHSEKQFHDQTQGTEANDFRLKWRMIVRVPARGK
jgi:hypothetical protein